MTRHADTYVCNNELKERVNCKVVHNVCAYWFLEKMGSTKR
jgi:hypothetical protein